MTMKPLTDIEEIQSHDYLIESLGFEIIETCSVGPFYEGEHLWLLRRLNYNKTKFEYAYLNRSYGSCSSNDELQACETLEDYEELRGGINRSIEWETPQALLNWLETHDWQGDYSNHYEPLFGLVIDLFKARLRVEMGGKG